LRCPQVGSGVPGAWRLLAFAASPATRGRAGLGAHSLPLHPQPCLPVHAATLGACITHPEDTTLPARLRRARRSRPHPTPRPCPLCAAVVHYSFNPHCRLSQVVALLSGGAFTQCEQLSLAPPGVRAGTCTCIARHADRPLLCRWAAATPIAHATRPRHPRQAAGLLDACTPLTGTCTCSQLAPSCGQRHPLPPADAA